MTQRFPSVPRVPLSPKELAELAQLAFEWPVRQAPRLMLPLCILAAGAIQALMMVLFSISYSSPSDKKPETPQFYFLPPESAAARQLAPWLEANDPAVFSPLYATKAASPSIPPLKYRPSYEEPPPPMRPLRTDPMAEIQPPLPPLLPTPLKGKVPNQSATTNERMASQQGNIATVVRWEDGLAGRIPEKNDGFYPAPLSSRATVNPALFELAVGPEGLPMHCMLMETSGDPASDENAKVWIMERRFRPSETTSWGRVRVLWGAPISSGTPKPSSPPSNKT